MGYRKDDFKLCQPRNNTKFEIDQTVMAKNHAHPAFEPKYLMDYRVLKVLNESTLLLVTPNGKECKRKIGDIKPATTLELTENTCNSFLNLIVIIA